MTDEQELEPTGLTSVEPSPKIPRLDGKGFYEEGDRIIARDLAGGNVERFGTVGLTGSDGMGKDYMVVRYGEEPFLEAFICAAGDVVEILPDPEDAEQLEQWLEKGL